MKTKEEIIAVIEKIKSLNIALSVADYEAVLHYLKLSTINPMKIDEERFMNCFYNHFQETMFAKRNLNIVFDEYNSTCKDHQVLQPLPSEMPLDFKKIDYKEEPIQVWRWIISKYGTPTKKELVSVEELEKEIYPLIAIHSSTKVMSQTVAKHFHNTYSLNPPKRDEFPFNLKKGDKLMSQGFVKTFSSISKPLVLFEDGGNNYADQCQPYHEPSIHDKVKEKLGNELYEEFMKEVKGA